MNYQKQLEREKNRFSKFLFIIDKHIFKIISKDEIKDIRTLESLMSIREMILQRIQTIIKIENQKKFWEDYEKEKRRLSRM